MKSEPISLIWKGSQSENHSIAKVNRNICKGLLKHEGIDLHIMSSDKKTLQKQKSRSDVTVYHHWPPNWTEPNSKYWVCMQPWEFGAIPKEWYTPMKDRIDQIWVYNKYNKECYIRCGIPENKIKVIPLGVDEAIYHYNVRPLELKSDSSFHFLFVGGTLSRKGIDTLLQAYVHEFSADEDVCLVIKDFGFDSFYQGITSEKMITELSSQPDLPRILYLSKYYPEQELAGLYKACDCLVYPYRGEGFGMPIIEAMACGTPAIVPNKGPSQDFCDVNTAFLLSCEEESLNQKQIGNLETLDYPWWFKVDRDELQRMMRFVYENRRALKKKGRKASQRILSSFTWKQTATIITDHIQQLVSNHNPVKRDKQDLKVKTVEIRDKAEDRKDRAEEIRDKTENRKDKAEEIKDKTENIPTKLQRGVQLCVENRVEEGIEIFLDILSENPDSLEAGYHAALAFIKNKDYFHAIYQLTQISKGMSSEAEAFQAEIWSLLGVCYSQLQSFRTAIDAFQKAAKINPSVRSREIFCLKKGLQGANESVSKLYHELGDCYSEMGNDFRAEEMYLKALEKGDNQTTIIDALVQVYERIHSMKKNITPIQQNHPIPSKSVPSESIIWVQSTSYPLEDPYETVRERRNWEPYFVGGDRVLELQWRDQTDIDHGEIDPPFDGLVLLLRENSISASDLVNRLKQCFTWISPTGKIIIVIENPDQKPVPASLKTMLETFLNSAGWSVKETNTLNNEDRFYIVSQRAIYEVLWQSPLYNSSGYSEEQKSFLDGIRPYPLRVKTYPLDQSPSHDSYPLDMKPYLSALQNRSIKTPLIHYQAAPANLFSFPVAPISIGRTMFETDSLPQSWVEILNEMSEVWVPSEFNRDTFASAGVKLERIQIMPGTLDENKYNPLHASPYSFKEKDTYKFLSVFDWSIRKGWDVLLQAYFEEFTQEDDVSLILKVSRINEPNTDPYSKVKELAKKLGLRKRPHVHFIQERLSEEDMIGLYAAADCFVLPSRGEGWGRPYMEAMAMELPTIGTKWSSQQTFMDDSNSYLVDIEALIPVDPNEMPAHFHGHRWAEPSTDHLKALMRHVYNHPAEAKQKGLKARKDLFPKYSRKTIGNQIYQRMTELVKDDYGSYG